MADYGMLVLDWPLVPGCDAGGVIVKAGSNAINPVTGKAFKEGDEVMGCTRLGSKGYSPWQEFVSQPKHYPQLVCSTGGLCHFRVKIVLM
jgi:NADPH:quinone reductase-like Zn-dependent oxidoreductase